MFGLTSIVAWVLSHWASKLISFVPVIHSAPASLQGSVAVYRVLSGLGLFHALHAVGLIGLSSPDDPRASFHTSLWWVKVPLLLVLVFGMFFIPDSALTALSYIGLVLAAVFIVLQLILLVGVTYDWAGAWIDNLHNAPDGQTGWYKALLAATFALYAVAIGLAATSFQFFAKSSSHSTPGGCGTNTAFITINMIIWIVTSALSVLPAVQAGNERSGLLQSAAVAAYSSYLVLSALLSLSPDASCAYAPAAEGTGTSSSTPIHLTSLIAGAAFTVISVGYSATKLSLKDDDLRLDADPAAAPILASSDPEMGSTNAGGDDSGGTTLVYSVSWFHASFMLAAAYVAMLLTNWAILSHGANGDSLKVNSGNAAVWVQMSSSWLVHLLYFWTLVAPIILTNRDFS